MPSYMRGSAPVQKKTWRVQLPKRRKILLIVLTIALLVPSYIVIFEIINAVMLYKQIQGRIAQLQGAETGFLGGSGSCMAKYFEIHKLHQAQGEIDAAHVDCVSLNDKLDHETTSDLLSNLLPTQVSAIRALSHIATDGTAAAQILIKTVIDIAPSITPAFQKSPSQTNTMLLKAYISRALFQEINKALDAITPLVHDMTIYARGLTLNTLPISSKQHQLLASVLPLLPVLAAALSQEHELRNALGWVLGVDHQRTFLIEPMDSAELRATGGFTGQL